ncbi:myristoylated alanine-rich C-kinase substrate-like [Ahaetulla prasina]|uniref:myristoylated alanine-rich C-kinase substrate-like n=1 Tax=Ahaetulla prasina TaxID=499056 RepID=UPI002648A087|nr:myristoylated alanine-rich C-kinase substrate-like [Ahaetulla prasina]
MRAESLPATQHRGLRALSKEGGRGDGRGSGEVRLVEVSLQAQLQASESQLRLRGSSDEAEGSAVGRAESLARAGSGSQKQGAEGAGQPGGEEERGEQLEAQLGAEGSAGEAAETCGGRKANRNADIPGKQQIPWSADISLRAGQLGTGQPGGEEERGEQLEAKLGAEGSAGDASRQQRPPEAATNADIPGKQQIPWSADISLRAGQLGAGQPGGEEERGEQPEAKLGAEGSAGDASRQQRPPEAAT